MTPSGDSYGHPTAAIVSAIFAAAWLLIAYHQSQPKIGGTSLFMRWVPLVIAVSFTISAFAEVSAS
jgi:hypothetical protein